MLGNIADYDGSKGELTPLDEMILSEFNELTVKVNAAYRRYDFRGVVDSITSFMSGDLSSFYLDCAKDVLYCDKKDSPRRVGLVSVIYRLCHDLCLLLNPILPFTRYVAGPADYTICYYRQDFGRLEKQEDAHGVPRSRNIQTTPAHQLALAAVYYSPLQHLYWYDKPSDCQDEPELKFFDDVYTVWDDTKVLEGEPGEFITNAAREAAISLDFLPAGNYIAEIYTDGDASIPTRTKVRVSKFRVNAGTVLRFSLRKAGGAAVRFVPEPVKDRV